MEKVTKPEAFKLKSLIALSTVCAIRLMILTQWCVLEASRTITRFLALFFTRFFCSCDACSKICPYNIKGVWSHNMGDMPTPFLFTT